MTNNSKPKFTFQDWLTSPFTIVSIFIVIAIINVMSQNALTPKNVSEIMKTQEETVFEALVKREEAVKRACISNQRVLIGAIEMYNLEKDTMIQTIEQNTLLTLLRAGYINRLPICPDHGSYESMGDLTGDGQITCTIHGSAPKIGY